MSTILALDQGSSGTKAILITNGEITWQASLPVQTYEYADGRVEQNGEEVLSGLQELIATAKQFAKNKQTIISKIALSCQRSAVLAWDKCGKALHPIITWRDRRTKAAISTVKEKFGLIRQASGLPVLPDYSASKIAYLHRLFPSSDVYVGTLDSYILYNLSDQKHFVTDDSMAARSLVYDLNLADWSSELCHILEVDHTRLARILPSINSELTIQGITLKVMLGDGQAALAAVLPEHTAVLNMGTISSISVFTDQQLVRIPGFISSVYYSENNQATKFMIEGITNASGDVINWLANELKLDNVVELLKAIQLPDSEPDSLAYLPIRGTATPNWQYDLSNIFEPALELNNRNLILISGALSIANFIAKNIQLLKDNGILSDKSKLIACGGLSAFEFLLSYISSVCNISIIATDRYLGSVYGIARLVGGSLANDPLTNNKLVPVGPKWCINYHQRWLEIEQRAQSA